MLSIIEVVAKCLAYVKQIAIAEINKTQLVDVDCKEIHWILTVPAIWTDAAKVRWLLQCNLVIKFPCT